MLHPVSCCLHRGVVPAQLGKASNKGKDALEQQNTVLCRKKPTFSYPLNTSKQNWFKFCVVQRIDHYLLAKKRFLELPVDHRVNLVEAASERTVSLFWKCRVKLNCIYGSKTPRAHWYFIELWFDRLLILASGNVAPVERVSNSHWIKLSKVLKPVVRDWLALAAVL